ncbi:MAG: hypothetical protein II057_04945, partial [Clostridia bacterium]|nr:hypothetical protein [Clostridia bacterium]
MLLGSPPDMIHSAPSHRTHAPYGQTKAHSAFISAHYYTEFPLLNQHFILTELFFIGILGRV